MKYIKKHYVRIIHFGGIAILFFMGWLGIILGIILILITLWLHSNATYIISKFRHANVLVWGKKRTGKDLTFQKVINYRKEEYFSFPFAYGGKHHAITLQELSIAPNYYKDFIEGTLQIIPYHKEREKRDVYISDGGNYLPSQYQGDLVKKYPSMPVYYSIVGHLYDSNMHVNYNGSFTRLWDKLREQADDYIKVLGTMKIGPFMFTKITYYAQQKSAEQSLLPMKRGALNKDQKALYQQYIATNGEIKNKWFCQYITSIHYDTRYFRKVFFGVQVETDSEPENLKKV